MKTLSKYCDSLLQKMETELLFIQGQSTDLITECERSIPLCRLYLGQLRKYISEHPFQRRSEEVYFFKEVQPVIVAKLIYYAEIFNTEQEMMLRSYVEKKQLLDMFEIRLLEFFSLYRKFIEYYESGRTDKDFKIYITAPKNPFYDQIGNPLYQDPVQFYGALAFSTSHDYRTARIIAYRNLQRFVKARRKELSKAELTPAEETEFLGSPGEFVDFMTIMKGIFDTCADSTSRDMDTEQFANELQMFIKVDLGEFDDYKTPELFSNRSDLQKRLIITLEGYLKELDEEEKDAEYDKDGREKEDE